MSSRFSTVFLSVIFSLSLFSQKTQTINQIFTIAPTSIVNPYMLDSVNLKGKKFGEKELLQTNISVPDQSRFVRPLKSDTAGYFYAEKPKERSTLQLFSFYVSSDRYAKGTLKVTSPYMFEIYIDGKLATSKTTREDNMRGEKNATTSLNPYPLSSRVVVKLLAGTEDKAPVAFKISIENEENDSTTIFTTTNTNKRSVNFTDMMLGKRVTKTSMSCNGNYILISYRNTLGEKSLSSTDIYNVKTAKQILIDTDGNKKQLRWLPKKELLSYVSKADGNANMMLIDPATLEETVLAKNIPDEQMIVSPDERSLFFTKEEKGEENKSDFKLFKSPEDRQSGYTNRSFLYKYDISTGLSQQLTFGANSVWLNDISADAKQIIFALSQETVTERPFRKYSVFKMDLATMEVDTLWLNEGFAHGAKFSPDANKVLISGSGEAFGGIGMNIAEGQTANSYNSLAFIMDLKTKQIEPITKNFSPSIDGANWNPQDNMIYLRTTDKDCVNIYAYNPSNKSFTKLPLDEDVIRSFSTADNGTTGAYMGVSRSNSTRAYVYDIKTQKSILIADPYKDRLAEMELGKVEDWNFTNSAGTTIMGSCYLPPNFDSSKKYPMIVYYYGGTTPTARTFEGPYPPHVFASQDYVTYVIQPSGAIGFGQEFAALHVNAWGKRTAEDIMEGVKEFVKEHPFVDDKKIGCIGASYGGFMTMYLQTQTDMFAAAVSHAGISSISSYWGEGYWGYTYSGGASANSYPWNNHDLYVKQSPLFSADKINTPILLTHGAVDTNVPIGESIQMYTALKVLGKPVEFLQIKDENHGIMNYKRRVKWNNSIMAWFDKWLKDDNNWWKGLYSDSK